MQNRVFPEPVKGESYVVGVRLSDVGASVLNDLNGTLVTADQPIVMNSGSWLVGATPNHPFRHWRGLGC